MRDFEDLCPYVHLAAVRHLPFGLPKAVPTLQLPLLWHIGGITALDAGEQAVLSILLHEAKGMQPRSYVLLYDCWTCYDGYSSVQLKLLSLEHPFAKTLLRKGSRPQAAKQNHCVTIWRSYTKTYDKKYHCFVDTWGYRREAICWQSQYGEPSEDHLLLFHCMEAWLKAEAPVEVEVFDSPLLIEGIVRLDNEEHSNALRGISSWQHYRKDSNQEDSNQQYSNQEQSIQEESTQEGSIQEESDNQENNVPSLEMSGQAAYPEKTALTDTGSFDNIAIGPTISSEYIARNATTSQDQQTLHKQCDSCSSTAGTSLSHDDEEVFWQFSYGYPALEDTILSCTQSEVHQLLSDFMQQQAHEQLLKFKQELLERVADAFNDWELV